MIAFASLRPPAGALAYVPLLYAGSSTSPSPELRSGRGTVFECLGEPVAATASATS